MPRAAIAGGRRFPVSLRVTEELKDSLGAAAQVSGRSLAQEIEHRLEMSLHDDRTFGGPGLARIGFLMAAQFAIRSPDVNDPQEFRAAMVRVFSALLDNTPGDPVAQGRWVLQALESHVLTREEQRREQVA